MPFDIQGSHVEEVGIVTEQSQPVIAPLTEKFPDAAGRVIMI
jgi:hypothetical protein